MTILRKFVTTSCLVPGDMYIIMYDKLGIVLNVEEVKAFHQLAVVTSFVDGKIVKQNQLMYGTIEVFSRSL